MGWPRNEDVQPVSFLGGKRDRPPVRLGLAGEEYKSLCKAESYQLMSCDMLTWDETSRRQLSMTTR